MNIDRVGTNISRCRRAKFDTEAELKLQKQSVLMLCMCFMLTFVMCISTHFCMHNDFNWMTLC